jgi:hypothetical protein
VANGFHPPACLKGLEKLGGEDGSPKGYHIGGAGVETPCSTGD